MKTIIRTTAVFVTMMIIGCSSDDDNTTEEPISERLEYEYNIETDIPNGTGETLIVTIPIDQDKIVIDPTKVFVEITLDHDKASDLTYGYFMPNESVSRIIIAGLGGNNNYDRNNILSFNPNHTQAINTTQDYPGGIIPRGNYKQGTYSEGTQVETPLFHNMMNKNIRGNWRFLIEDYQDDLSIDDGSLIKIKLIFDEGALEVNDQ